MEYYVKIKLKNPAVLSLWLMVASFTCYTGMYAVRKSFLALSFEGDSVFGMDLKSVMIISQILGYMLSKMYGVKLLSELHGKNRVKFLVGFVLFGLMMLVVTALVPVKYVPLSMFLNGLPLGMVFGLVMSYLEGRTSTELLTAALSSTFIFSTGLIKSIGQWLHLHLSINEFHVPWLVGLIFFPFFLISVWMLYVSPDPTNNDIKERLQRKEMNAKDRLEFLKSNFYMISLLVLTYVALTILRDFRDNFMVNLWDELAVEGIDFTVYTVTETPIAIVTLLISASLIRIKNNIKALNTSLYLNVICSVVLFVSTMLYGLGVLGAVAWMVISGFALYLPYILFHTSIYERLIPVIGSVANVAFLFYMSDSIGYCGSVILLLVKDVFWVDASWLGVYFPVVYSVSIGVCMFSLLAILGVAKYRR